MTEPKEMPRTTTDTAQVELEAMQQCLDALQWLERPAQVRTVRWLLARVEGKGA